MTTKEKGVRIVQQGGSNDPKNVMDELHFRAPQPREREEIEAV